MDDEPWDFAGYHEMDPLTPEQLAAAVRESDPGREEGIEERPAPMFLKGEHP